jgi:uncharacterized protein YjbI with pentapeptide repeats
MADFCNAKFSGRKSYFTLAKFSEEVNFSNATFSGDVLFDGAKFCGKVVHFGNATFSKIADFFNAKFSSRTESIDFRLATFSGVANFGSVHFHAEKIDFSYAKFFGEMAIFIETIFLKEAIFSSATFSGRAYFSCRFHGKTYFNYVLFEDGKKILFWTENLSKVSFANTDITCVRFKETARWGEGKGKNDKFKVFEERQLEKFLKFSFEWGGS